MSPSQAIQAYIEAFNTGNEEALLNLLAEDVVHEINEGGVEVGRDAFRAFRQHMNTCYRERLSEVTIAENGDFGACEFLCSGTYLKTDAGLPEANGQTYAIRAGFFVRMRGGKIAKITSSYNLRAWIEAVR